MIIEEKAREAVELFLQNPYWREYYETAPSEYSKRGAELAFYWSVETNESKVDEAMAEAKEIEKHYSLDDCRHEFKYSGNDPGRLHWLKRIEELSKKGE
ncbi:MAG: hypothetical protein IKI24_03190 [Clostridia bacterium]|nr:hypothetical protein [Clostridia bacterium]